MLSIFKYAVYAFKLIHEQHQHESYVPIPSLAYFFLLQQHHRGAKCCSMHIQNMSGVAQCAIKYGESCSILSSRRLGQHKNPSWYKKSSFRLILDVHRTDKDKLGAAHTPFKIKMLILNDFGT
jgi:hypothetical protein